VPITDPLQALTASLADRYVIEREVGRGGMATVYLARDVKHHRQVAVKVLHPELAAAIGRERFLREIEVAARLRHPHIIPLHDSGDADGTLYYVMPYVEGESLRDKLEREKQLTIDEALHVAREVADALAYAHAHGVIHRDIKPANILLESNHAVVTDFGIALVPAASDRLTATGLSPGTPEYMSPEQATGERDVDARSDIYSLGCVLYEMLCGDAPYTGADPQAVLARKISQPIPSLRVVRATVTPSLERVTRKALARTPADRYRTAGEFAEALAAASAAQAGTAPGVEETWLEPAPGPSMEAFPARGPSLSRRLGIGVAYLVAGGALLTGIGFLTTAVYDVKLRIPAEFTPTRTDFPVLGIRAVIPGLTIAFVALAGYVVLEYLTRLLVAGLRRVRPIGPRLVTWQRRSADTWHRLLGRTSPVAVAELYFIVSLVVSVAVLSRFWPLLASLWSGTTEPLSPSFRSLHRGYTIAMTVLITGLGLAWRRVFRYLEARQASGGRLGLAKWGGVAWIVILVLLMTMPWRLLWQNEYPRALLQGERVYILRERGSDLLLYNAERRVTERHRRGEDPDLQLQNTIGYVFEDAEAFAGRPGR
jgi:tRNA A-37 threonylcarbamoyl transferase component Bud32